MTSNPGTRMLGAICCGLVAFSACLTATVADAADPQAAEEVLKEKGTRKVSSNYVLEEEFELSKGLRAVPRTRRDMLRAAKAEATAEAQLAAKEKLIVDYLQQRRQLRAQLTAAKSASQYNRIVGAIQELGDRVVLMQGDKQLEEHVKQVRAAASTAREEYIQALLDMRELSQTIEEKYADLAIDPEVVEALKAVNSASDKSYALGPGTSFQRNLIQLKKLEDGILSESIDLRRQGDLFSVTVMFNGKYTQELAVDTGASVVCLPLAMAREVGVEPTEDDRVIQLSLADGSIVEAKLVTIDELRVGKFTVEKVECAVMGEELPNAAPLLGQSFLRHFTYKLDPQTAKLIMTKVEPGGSR